MTTAAALTPPLTPDAPLTRRPATEVMRLARMGAAFPTRLSFMRTLLRRLAQAKVQVTRGLWDMDDAGHGQAVYSLTLGGHDYSLVAISTPLADADRSDRVIAEAWDAAFVLYDGIPSAAEVARLAATAPKQEACRYTARDLTLSRANKSARLFAEVTAALASGRQPDPARIDQIGYLMRTTAVYGNGKFGIADRDIYAGRPGLGGPFQAEMLTVWLIRAFTHDLVEHVAARRAPDTAVRLDPALKRYLGIGNATGLGMAPFLVSHPELLNAWAMARETALARILATGPLNTSQQQALPQLIARVQRHLDAWQVDDARQMQRIQVLKAEMSDLALDLTVNRFEDLWLKTQNKSLECQELIQAVLIDLNPDLVDDLADQLAVQEAPAWHPSQTVAELKTDIERAYAWALNYDFTARDQTALFWYTSEEKLEPRLGHRYEEPGADKERPLDIARQVQGLYRALTQTIDQAADQPLATFFMAHPGLRAIAARVQTCRDLPYAEIHDNLIAETCLPIDMLRFKLAMFGANKFDPKSNLWTRITLFQGAPLINEPLDQDWGFACL